jgi:hypothetical protein
MALLFLFFLSSLLAEPIPVAAPAGEIDGVVIQAVENLTQESTGHFDLCVGLYPFNSYYNAFSLSADLMFGLSSFLGLQNVVSWRVLKMEYFYTFNTSLSVNLAQQYSVNPVQVDRVQYILATELLWDLAFGKFVMFDSVIRNFNFSLITGGGLISTKQSTGASANLGLRVVTHSPQSLHWIIEAEDQYAVSENVSYFVFRIGTGIAF